MSSWGSPLLDPKKLRNEQFYIIDWIWKKLLVDVANLATCCHDDYDVLLEVLGTLGKCYVSSPVAKTLKIMTGTTGRCCQSGLLAAMMIMMYYWRFWEPWANAMLVVLLPKLWKSWLAQQFFLGMSSWGSPLLDPKKLQNASKSTILHNRLNREKTPGRCCQSDYLLPWWLWCTIGGFGNPGQMLC